MCSASACGYRAAAGGARCDRFVQEHPIPPGLQLELAELVAKTLGVRLDTDWIVFRRSARRVNCDALMSSIDRTGIAQHSELPEPIVRQALTRSYALDYDAAVTLRNTDQKLVLAVNRILSRLMADGCVAPIFETYGIRYRPPSGR